MEIDDIFREMTGGSEGEEAVASIFRGVRDIPYGSMGSRDPLEVYGRNMGTCGGKHLLLADLLERLDLPVKHHLAFHRFADLPRRTDYPQTLRELALSADGVPDYHDFVEVQLDGRWIRADATFDRGLERCFVVNEWTGEDMPLSVKPLEVHETTSPLEEKESRLGSLDPGIQEARAQFLEAFTDWLQWLRD